MSMKTGAGRKRIRKKMECSNVENYEAYLQAKSDLNEKKAERTANLVKLDSELQKYRADKAFLLRN